MRKNVSGQVVTAQLISKTDGSAVTSGTTNVYVLGDGGSQVGGDVATHEGVGVWSFSPAQGQTNYDHVAFTFVNSSAISVTVQIYTIDALATTIAAHLTSGVVNVSGPVVNPDTGDFDIIQGDDYKIADSRSINFTLTTQLTLSSATVVLRIQTKEDGNNSGVPVESSSCTVTGSAGAWLCKFEFNDTDTVNLDPGRFQYDIQATLASGNIVTLNNPTSTHTVTKCTVHKQVQTLS